MISKKIYKTRWSLETFIHITVHMTTRWETHTQCLSLRNRVIDGCNFLLHICPQYAYILLL